MGVMTAFLSLLVGFLSYFGEGICLILTVLLISTIFGRNYKVGKRELIVALCIVPLHIVTLLGAFGITASFVGYRYGVELKESGYVPESQEALTEKLKEHLYEMMGEDVSSGPFVIVSTAVLFILLLYIFIYFFKIHKREKRLRRFLLAAEGASIYLLIRVYTRNLVYSIFMVLRGNSGKVFDDVFMGTGSSTFISEIVILLIYTGLAALLYFRLYKRNRIISLKRRYVLLFILWTLTIIQIPNFIFSGEFSQEETMWYMQIVIAIVIPVIGIAMPIFVFMSVLREQLLEKSLYQETYLNAELDYIEQYKRSERETRAFRHDIINNLSLANMLLQEGKTDEVGEHISQLLGNVSALSPQYVTGDEMLDCIVSMKAERMKELGITFTHDGVVDGGLNLKPMDICSIFANAFDNAIEGTLSYMDSLEGPNQKLGTGATVETSEADTPWIDFNITRTGRFFILRLSNPCKSEVHAEHIFEQGEGFTTKEDKKHHGFGTRNMKRTVEEASGMLRAETEGNGFILSIMLPR